MGKQNIRGCNRCKKGEVFIDHDQYGWYECCLQCGYTRDLPDIAQPAPARDRSAAIEAVPKRRSRSMSIRRGSSK